MNGKRFKEEQIIRILQEVDGGKSVAQVCRFTRTAYQEQFGKDIDTAFGSYLRLFRLLGFLRDDGDRIVLSDRGSFWLHAWEDILSIEYISELWGASKRDLWPEEVVL